MIKHPTGDKYHKAAMAGDVRLFVAELVHETSKSLSREISAYQSDSAELAGRADHSIPNVETICDLASAEMQAEASLQAATMTAMGTAAVKAESELRAFQYEHGITRAPVEADRTLAFALLLLFLFIEGAINTVFFYSAGFASGIAPAAALGFTIAGVTTLLSAGLGGGFFGRYWNYGILAPEETPDMRKARRFGRVGSILTGTAIALVLSVAALVRTTGQPNTLQISPDVLVAALTNMHSIMLMLSGTGFAILSWRTALSAFEDLYPGFSRASAKSASAAADRKAASDAAFDTLKAIQIKTMDDLADCADAIAHARREPDEDFEAQSDEYHRLHGLIDQREAEIREQAASFLQAQHIIAKTTSEFSLEGISLDDLRAKICPPERPVFDDLGGFRGEYKAAVNALTGAYSAALARLDLADPALFEPSSSSQA